MFTSPNRFQICHVPSLHDCHRKCWGSYLWSTTGFSQPVTVGQKYDRASGKNHENRSGEFLGGFFLFSIEPRTSMSFWSHTTFVWLRIQFTYVSVQVSFVTVVVHSLEEMLPPLFILTVHWNVVRIVILHWSHYNRVFVDEILICTFF